jgi:hypothetical protein
MANCRTVGGDLPRGPSTLRREDCGRGPELLVSDSGSGNVVTFQTTAQRDREILQLRLAGIGISQLAHRFRCKERTIIAALNNQLPQLDNETRFRYLRESVSQLDQLMSWWWPKAKDQPAAASLCLKINEQRAQLLGIGAPVKVDVVRIGDEPPQTSTEELLTALKRIADEGAGSKMIEHEPSPNLLVESSTHSPPDLSATPD